MRASAHILFVGLAVAGCGRAGFDVLRDSAADSSLVDSTDDAAPLRFCTEAQTRIPGDAQVSLCEDFEGVTLGGLDHMTYLIPGRLFVREDDTFAEIAIVKDAIATTRAFRYQPAATTPVCVSNCCYSDVFFDYGELVFTSHAHVEYDHYIENNPGSWIGGLFWGDLDFPYMMNGVTPSLETGRWHHVTIDGDVMPGAALTITVDGVVRSNSAGTNNLYSGIQGAVGLYCWGDPGAGYIDNLMFWAK